MNDSLIGYSDMFDPELNIESSLVRGIVINALTLFERTIDAFLSNHFCRDKSRASELMTHVFATKYITFENKRMIFQSLTDTHHKEYKKLNLGNIHKSLEKFNRHRNILAHCVVDLKPKSIELFKSTKEVTFLKFEKSIEQEIYTRETAAQLANEIYDFIKPIAQMIDM
ncbi:MAG: hypothetical protein M3139_13350 [Bacteroidota bacterium]|nr:hypothetical protein [Bacteroidota bacterium]